MLKKCCKIAFCQNLFDQLPYYTTVRAESDTIMPVQRYLRGHYLVSSGEEIPGWRLLGEPSPVYVGYVDQVETSQRRSSLSGQIELGASCGAAYLHIQE